MCYESFETAMGDFLDRFSNNVILKSPAKRWQPGAAPLSEFKRPDQTRANRVLQSDEQNTEAEEYLSTRKIMINGLPSHFTATKVRELVSKYGEVTSVMFANVDPKLRGVSVSVVFNNPNNAASARSDLDQTYLGEGYWATTGFSHDINYSTSKTLLRTGFPFNSAPRSISVKTGGYRNAPPPLAFRERAFPSQDRLEVKVQYPESLRALRKIHLMVENVVKYGPEFEAAIMARERNNPEFAFLFDTCMPDHVYYRWKAWSVASGEGVNDWNTSEVEIFNDGIVWIPPPKSVTIDDELERLDSEDEEAGTTEKSPQPWLGSLAHLHLTLLLKHISMRRGAIARVMAFAMDHSHAADEIVDVVCESIVDPEATITDRIARLWAVGDILHNSGLGIGGISKGTWKYRGL